MGTEVVTVCGPVVEGSRSLRVVFSGVCLAQAPALMLCAAQELECSECSLCDRRL